MFTSAIPNLVPKAKEAIEPKVSEEIIHYDSKAAQTVSMYLRKNGKEFRVAHILNSLSPERYFQFQESDSLTANRLKRVSSSAVEPLFKLWEDLCTGTTGYIFSDKENWKTKVKREDAVGSIGGLLLVQILDDEELESDGKEELYDDEAPSKLVFRAMYSGALVTLTHNFREVSQAEADEFLSITSNQPNENQLASAVKMSEAEKLYRLGKRVLVDTEGYADGSEIPAWHLSATTKEHFTREAARMGKFLTPSHLMPGV